ncbi:MAG: anaerobic ribonucleoside-triphosphate reductase activating protein [Candidatus Bipolaricaulota bacterium]|nr:anaerobic ribonucleoside-triphosphate reductase activating protein [Candidatus Bipolaricaulota bacterium]MDW8126741.1 anaerobic ribonucleoside-triphosphate reductase activating protein [Candidatus Bipolaricaulota bacterium]
MSVKKAFGQIVWVQPLTLLDYPGKLAALVFFGGCNLRCPFCYNAELVLPELLENLSPLSLEEVLNQLAERVGFLDGVVITGGEPTLSPSLPDFVRRLKNLGFLVKLDTNGTNPAVLADLLATGLLDYVALDFKAPLARYGEYTGLAEAGRVVEAVCRSFQLIAEKAPDYEVRTTVAPGLTAQDLLQIAQEISGAKRYVLQPFFAPPKKRLVEESWRRPALNATELKRILPELQRFVPTEIRG